MKKKPPGGSFRS